MDLEEPPRKRKKSGKEKKKSKAAKARSKEANALPPLPPEPNCHTPSPPVLEIYESEDVSSFLPAHSDDSELDLSSLMADHVVQPSHVSAVEDCVLPTVPSLADMLSQSDICSSIASAGSSMDDGDNSNEIAGPINRESNLNIEHQTDPVVKVLEGPATSSTSDVAEAGNTAPQSLSHSIVHIGSENTSSANEPAESEGLSTASLEEQTTSSSADPLAEASRMSVDDQEELQAHAHHLLDSTPNVKGAGGSEDLPRSEQPSSTGLESDGVTASEQASSTSLGSETPTEKPSDGLGYQLMSRYLIQDVIPKHHYEPLPEGWKELTHSTGLPLYCHLKTRVITWSRPYFLSDRYAKSHDVPACAIPCMLYKRCKESQKAGCPVTKGSDDGTQNSTIQSNGDSDAGSQTVTSQSSNHAPVEGAESACPEKTPDESVTSATVMIGATGDSKDDATAKTGVEQNCPIISEEPDQKISDLSTEQLIDYCKPVFIFQKKEFKKFDSWQSRKDHEKAQKKKTAITKPGGNVIMIPVSELQEQYQRDDKGKLKRDFYSIAGTHTAIDVLTCYVTWVFRKVPYFESVVCTEGFNCSFKIKESDVVYGTGVGPTKKLAKEACAQNGLKTLIPKYADRILENTLTYGNKEKTEVALDDYYKVFDKMSIKDERVLEVAKETNQIYPLSMLKACICRNFAMSDKDVKVETKLERKGRHIKILCDMTVGQHSTKGVAGKNTKAATHFAAQDILQQLHPHLTSWGSILRMYGKFSEGSYVNQKHESANQLEITKLQKKDHDSPSHPLDDVNHSVLNKLRQQMKQIHKQRQKNSTVPSKKKFDHGGKSEAVTDSFTPLVQTMPATSTIVA